MWETRGRPSNQVGVPLGVSTRMAGRISVVLSNAIWTDEADEMVGVDGADG